MEMEIEINFKKKAQQPQTGPPVFHLFWREADRGTKNNRIIQERPREREREREKKIFFLNKKRSQQKKLSNKRDHETLKDKKKPRKSIRIPVQVLRNEWKTNSN